MVGILRIKFSHFLPSRQSRHVVAIKQQLVMASVDSVSSL